MGKRKAEDVEREKQDEGIQTLSTAMDREEEEASTDLNGNGEENLSDVEDSGEEFSDGDEYDDDPVGREEEEEEEQQPDAQGSTAFSRAFGKIMKKRVPESAITEISGPVLAERKQLLVKKFEEAENEAKAKTSSLQEKRQLREKGHAIPLSYTDAKEKALMKLATKGVVRLFNAVSKAQTVQTDADTSSRTAAKASWKQSKAAFMTQLRASSKTGSKGSQRDETKLQGGEEAEPTWSALRKDFMMGNSKKFMDWDKGDSGPVTET